MKRNKVELKGILNDLMSLDTDWLRKTEKRRSVE